MCGTGIWLRRIITSLSFEVSFELAQRNKYELTSLWRHLRMIRLKVDVI